LETARLIKALDLVITVDTMAAHLAGTLKKPVWTLLQADADWRRMLEREDTPWYPTMRLFSQRRQGEWCPVISSILHELERAVRKDEARHD
jgi:ADP-heptose:LPS heptosyltransferase